MIELLLAEDSRGAKMLFTTGSPLSANGRPVLRIMGTPVAGDYRASDPIAAGMTAGQLVQALALLGLLPVAARSPAACFLLGEVVGFCYGMA